MLKYQSDLNFTENGIENFYAIKTDDTDIVVILQEGLKERIELNQRLLNIDKIYKSKAELQEEIDRYKEYLKILKADKIKV